MDPSSIPFYYDRNEQEVNELLLWSSIGSYLLRRSSHPKAICTLSIRGRFEIFNVRIFADDVGGKCYLDSNEKPIRYFDSLKSLVDYFAVPERCLIGESRGVDTKFQLIKPVLKPRNSLDTW